MNKKIILLMIIFFFSDFCLCDDKFLDTCVRIGLQKNKKLLAKQQEIDLAKKQLWVTTRSFLPSIFLQRRYSRGKTLIEEYQAEDIGLRLYQPLYDGGRISAAHKYQSLALETAKLEYTKLKEEIIYKIKLAYYEYLSSVLEEQEIGKMLSEINDYYKKLENEYNAKAISDIELEEGKIFKQKVENMYEKSKRYKTLFENKLIALVGIKSLDEIIFPLPINIFESLPKEIDFDLQSLKNLLFTNNIELRKLKLNREMAEQRKKIAQGKVYPKFYFEGGYGQSGEAYVTEPLELATVWSGMIRLSWLFGGSSVESSYQKDKAIPREILDVSHRIDNTVLDTKIGLFDDIKYFVEKKEADVVIDSVEAEFEETKNALLLELEKFYNQYLDSLYDTKVNKDDLEHKKWRLEVVKKKNSLYEVSTVEVMNSVYQVSEAVLAYSKSILQNYTAVAELEKLVLIPLR